MTKEITFEISGSKSSYNRTSITKLVWDEGSNLRVCGLNDELYDALRYCGEHENYLSQDGEHQSTGKELAGCIELEAPCKLEGDTPEEWRASLLGFIEELAKAGPGKVGYITHADALRAKTAFGIQNVKSARAV